MKILKCSDRIKLTVDAENPISVTIKPLSVSDKMEIASKSKIVKGEEVQDHNAQAFLCIKFAVVEISGVENYDGTEYKLEFNGDKLADHCVDDLVSCLSESGLLLPIVLGSNKNIGSITGVKVEVNPKS